MGEQNQNQGGKPKPGEPDQEPQNNPTWINDIFQVKKNGEEEELKNSWNYFFLYIFTIRTTLIKMNNTG